MRQLISTQHDFVNSYLLTILLFLGCLIPGQVYAQGSCDGLDWEVDHYEPCKYRLSLIITKDCHNEATILLQNGHFSDVVANDAEGWEVAVISDTELLITHQNNIFPNGNTLAITFTAEADAGNDGELNINFPDLCAMESCISLKSFNVSACPKGSISGTVYRECESKDKAGQCTIPDIVVQLLDDTGLILDQQVADENGAYAFYDLQKGNYIVQQSNTPGWTPTVPAFGKYLVDLKPAQQEEKNFGLCPQCTCDDWEIYMTQEAGNGDTAYLNIYLIANNPWCLSEIELSVDSADIIGVEVLEGGWEPEIVSPKKMICPGPRIDVCPVFHRWKTTLNLSSLANSDGRNTGDLRIHGKGNTSPEPLCSDSIKTEHPSRYYNPFHCCPFGYVVGPNLVQNGDFSASTPLASDYIILTSGSLTPGRVRIMNDAQAYASNNNWVLPALSGPFDMYLACDGHTQPNQAAWKQQVFGLSGKTDYYFCAWLGNLVRTSSNFNDPSITLEIVDDATTQIVASSTLLTIPEIPKIWVKHDINWTTPPIPSASYTLVIKTTPQSGSGNDFAIDNISFQTCTEPPKDTCCKDLKAFCNDLEKNITFTSDSCKVTMDLSALLPCYTIEWVDWGNGPEYGPWASNTLPYPMHTFAGNGSYPISYLAIAYNDSNFICLEKIMLDTIEVQCVPCSCGKSGFTLEMNGQTYNLFCSKGAPTLELNCPAGDIAISGFFGCVDGADHPCAETVVNYTLTGPNGIIDQGTTTNFPTFFYPASMVNTPGTYTLTATTLCFGQTDSCECVATWIMPPCDTCYCGGFGDFYVRTYSGLMNQKIQCDDSPIVLTCPPQGNGYHFLSTLNCLGDSCATDHQINWMLVGPNTTVVDSFLDNDPYFSIYLLPNYFAQPGPYTLTVTGICNGDTCTCVLRFIIDCPNQCPCNAIDIAALSNNVNAGFVMALANQSCKVCFTPAQLSDCESVDWFIGSLNTPPVATTTGTATWCHTFPGPGSYTIIMVVTRYKSDGTICEVFTYAKTIKVTCTKWPICEKSIYPNPGFQEGAIAGPLGDGGASDGWADWGDPHENVRLFEGIPGSENGWSMLVSGCFFNSTVLISAEPICLSRDQPGTIGVRMRTPGDPIPGAMIKVGRKPPMGVNIMALVSPNTYQNSFDKNSKEIHKIMSNEILPLPDDDWYNLEIPCCGTTWIDDWEEGKDSLIISCGDNNEGVLAHIAVWVENLLSDDMGDGNVREGIFIDYLCVDGTVVSLQPIALKANIRLYPNPASQDVTLQLPWETSESAGVLISDVTGSAKLRLSLQPGQSKHILPIDHLLPGMYFVQVIENGVAIAVSRLAVQP